MSPTLGTREKPLRPVVFLAYKLEWSVPGQTHTSWCLLTFVGFFNWIFMFYWSNFPLSTCTTSTLSIPRLMDIFIASKCWLWLILLAYRFASLWLFDSHFSQVISPAVGVIDWLVAPCFPFQSTFFVFSWVALTTSPLESRVRICPQSRQHLLFAAFLLMAILTGVSW